MEQRPVVKGAYAMEQMQSAVSAAADSVDMHLKGPVEITLEGTSGEHSVVVVAHLFMNTDDGTFTIALPFPLPADIGETEFRVNYGTEFWKDIERQRRTPIGNAFAKEYRISKTTSTGCYMYRKPVGSANNFFPDFEPYYAGTELLDYLHIPEGTVRVGALVMHDYWTCLRVGQVIDDRL